MSRRSLRLIFGIGATLVCAAMCVANLLLFVRAWHDQSWGLVAVFGVFIFTTSFMAMYCLIHSFVAPGFGE